MQSESAKPPAARSRPGVWVLGGAAGAAVCLAIAVVASHRLAQPEAGIHPAPAVTAAPSAAQREQESGLVEADPAVAPPAAFVPWAYLDRAAEPAAAPTPPASRAGAEAPSSEESIAESEVQRVAGTQSADAGASLSAAAADAGAPLATAESEAPEPAPPGESCGFITCAAGYGCCNPSCGVCVAPGDNCDPTPCRDRVQYPASMVCGRSTCSVNQVCCNPSCGTCVAPGESCDETPCENAIQYPFSPICGRSTCSVGQVCCNPSCGICVNPGETCSQQPCG